MHVSQLCSRSLLSRVAGVQTRIPLQGTSKTDTSNWTRRTNAVRISVCTSHCKRTENCNTLSEFVWTPKKQRALIDSVLRNYYIPPVIFGEISHTILYFPCLMQCLSQTNQARWNGRTNLYRWQAASDFVAEVSQTVSVPDGQLIAEVVRSFKQGLVSVTLLSTVLDLTASNTGPDKP